MSDDSSAADPFDDEQFRIRLELWELVEQARRAGKWPYPEPGQP